MGLYRFSFHVEAGADPSVREVECPNDGAAAEAAFADLRRQPAGASVEVFEGGRLVTVMDRPSDTFLTSRSGLHGLG